MRLSRDGGVTATGFPFVGQTNIFYVSRDGCEVTIEVTRVSDVGGDRVSNAARTVD